MLKHCVSTSAFFLVSIFTTQSSTHCCYKKKQKKDTVNVKVVTGSHMVMSIFQSIAFKVTYKLRKIHSNFLYKNKSGLIICLLNAKC